MTSGRSQSTAFVLVCWYCHLRGLALPFCRVFIEFENVDDVAGQRGFGFSPDKLSLQVADADGKELPLGNGPYDGKSPLWEMIALPYAGSVKFQISFPGLGYRPATDKVIVDVGASRAWIIPQSGPKYFLSGTLSVKREESDQGMDRSGTLRLPNVAIPKEEGCRAEQFRGA